MAVTSQVPLVRYVASGGTDFAFPFRVPVAEHLKVFVAGVLTITGYSLTGIGDPAGGTLTFAVAPAPGTRIVLARQTPIERSTDYVEGGALRASELDDDFDAVTYMVQDIRADAITTTEFQTIADQIETDRNTALAAAATAVSEASDAADSAAAALASQIAAAASEASASASAGTATTQAGIATTQAGTATTQAGIATTQASNASTSAGNAATSETNAGASATAAAGSASAASGSASAASTSAGNAATSETNAAASAVAAAASAASVDAANLVQIAGTQTVTGAKTFTSIAVPTQAAGNSATDAASTAFVDRVRGLSVAESDVGFNDPLVLADRGSLKLSTNWISTAMDGHSRCTPQVFRHRARPPQQGCEGAAVKVVPQRPS